MCPNGLFVLVNRNHLGGGGMGGCRSYLAIVETLTPFNPTIPPNKPKEISNKPNDICCLEQISFLIVSLNFVCDLNVSQRSLCTRKSQSSMAGMGGCRSYLAIIETLTPFKPTLPPPRVLWFGVQTQGSLDTQ